MVQSAIPFQARSPSPSPILRSAVRTLCPPPLLQYSDRGSYARMPEAAKGDPVVGRIGWLPPKNTGCGPSRCWNCLTKSPVGPPGAPPGQWWADGCGRWPRCCAPWHGRRPGNLPQRSLGVGPYHIPAHVLRPTGGGGGLTGFFVEKGSL